MKIVGGLYSSGGSSPKDKTDYVVGVNEVDENKVREACMAYIDDYFGKDYFEKERGISLKKLARLADLSTSYERCIPINKNSIDYDIWGSCACKIGYSAGKGARKVWVLSFIDDPYKEAQHDTRTD